MSTYPSGAMCPFICHGSVFKRLHTNIQLGSSVARYRRGAVGCENELKNTFQLVSALKNLRNKRIWSKNTRNPTALHPVEHDAAVRALDLLAAKIVLSSVVTRLLRPVSVTEALESYACVGMMT